MTMWVPGNGATDVTLAKTASSARWQAYWIADPEKARRLADGLAQNKRIFHDLAEDDGCSGVDERCKSAQKDYFKLKGDLSSMDNMRSATLISSSVKNNEHIFNIAVPPLPQLTSWYADCQLLLVGIDAGGKVTATSIIPVTVSSRPWSVVGTLAAIFVVGTGRSAGYQTEWPQGGSTRPGRQGKPCVCPTRLVFDGRVWSSNLSVSAHRNPGRPV